MPSGKIIAIAVLAMSACALPCQAETYHNMVFGFSVAIPDGLEHCAIRNPTVMYGMRDEGVIFPLDHKKCEPPTPQDDRYYVSEGRAHIAVYGDWNANGVPSPKAEARNECLHGVADKSKKATPGIIPAGLKFPGHASATCRLDYADGKILIDVMTMAGPRTAYPDNDGSQVAAHDTEYAATLHTSMQRLDADLAVLRSLLKGVRIEKH